jgi:benzodiazapine receptor
MLMLAILGTLVAIYLRLGVGRAPAPLTTRLVLHLPFSVYLGWITVATIANVTALLVSVDWGGLGVAPATWTIVMILAATAITVAVILTRRDLAFTLVIAWAFLGIQLKRTGLGDAPAIAWTAIVAAGALVALALVWRLRSPVHRISE